MTPEEARRHAEHLCDVWPRTEEHIGVIGWLNDKGDRAEVSGHPQYGTGLFYVSELETSCKIED